MDRNQKIVVAATAVIALGSAALFAIKRVQVRNQEEMMDEPATETSEATTAPDLH